MPIAGTSCWQAQTLRPFTNGCSPSGRC
jgi:hypothetical protein